MGLDLSARTFRDILCLSFLASFSGVLIDADHWFAAVNHWQDARFLHHDLGFLVVYILMSGVIVTAFAHRWRIIETCPTIKPPRLGTERAFQPQYVELVSKHFTEPSRNEQVPPAVPTITIRSRPKRSRNSS